MMQSKSESEVAGIALQEIGRLMEEGELRGVNVNHDYSNHHDPFMKDRTDITIEIAGYYK